MGLADLLDTGSEHGVDLAHLLDGEHDVDFAHLLDSEHRVDLAHL